MHKKVYKFNFGGVAPYNTNFYDASLISYTGTQGVPPGAGGGDNGATKGGFKNFMSSDTGQGVMQLGSTVTSLIPNKMDVSAESQATKRAINDTLWKINPIAGAIGEAASMMDNIAGSFGIGVDELDADAAKRAGAGGAAMANKIINSIPGLSSSPIGWFAKDTDNMSQASQEAMNVMGSGYTGTLGNYQAAKANAGKRTLFGRNKLNKQIAEANEQLETIEDIATEASLRKQNDYAQALQSQNMRRYAGNQMMAAVGKRGTKLPSLKKIKHLEKTRRDLHDKYIEQLSKLSFPEPDIEIALNRIESEITKFKEGGKFNILAKGTYHCRNHHLEIKDSRFTEVTKKGIPVIVEDKNGNIIQTAEIEQNELIFNKEITDKIEALRKDGSDEAAIECGKLLVTQCTRHLRNKPKEDK